MGNGKKRIVFFGTSEVCLPFLNSLNKTFDLSLIITQPDSYGGRKKKLIEPPVKKFALTENLNFIQPEKLNSETKKIISEIKPEIGIVISYGKFLPMKIFDIPEFNTINVHFSLLPAFRGPAPVQRAIEKGEKSTGLTVFEIDKNMDTGPIWWQQEFKIIPDERSDELLKRLSDSGAELLPDIIGKIISGEFKKFPQNDGSASYAKIIKKEEGKINWNDSADNIYNSFRAFYPWPGLFFHSGGKKIIIKNVSFRKIDHDRPPGTIFKLGKEKMIICCGDKTVLEISMIQPAGKKQMTPFIYSLGNQIPDILD